MPDDGKALGVAADIPVAVADWGLAVAGVWADCNYPASGCDGRSRLAGECSGYTYYHLIRFKLPPKAVAAKRAIFAARIAFSSLRIRPLVR